MTSQDLDQKIQDVYKRIQTERKVLEASQLLRQATTNQDVLRRNDAKIKEAERSLSYFEDTLRELQARKMQLSDPSRSPGTLQPNSSPTSRSLPPGNRDRASQYSDSGGAQYSPEMHNAYLDGGPSAKAKNLTKLDLIKADTPHSPLKIARMLHQLEFKLQVEMQYKKGIEKMVKLYQADGDKKSRADAEGKRVESEKKIQLLQTALKRYKTLHVLDAADEDEEAVDPAADGDAKSGLRSKNLSGKLQVTIRGARELEHAPVITSGRSRSASKQVVDTYVSLKVEGTQRARTHPSRTDRWNEEFEITVDKANEVELAVYDKQASEPHPVPIALLWVKIQDLVDAIRRQRVNQETGQGGWVTAGDMNKIPGMPQPGHHSSGSGDYQPPFNSSSSLAPSGALGASYGGQSDGVEAWFALEPVGAVALKLNFVKENVRKRPLDAPGGLGRQGAVRKRKDEVHEMNGHKFVQKQFYQLLLCAFCSEFLLNAAGYQCEDCRYTCHKKCFEKVVTKCISKSTSGDGDEEKINHRIPHRFEPLTNIGTNWCCHCGYMLPFGRKNARRCTECDITCHANCAHLVPDFCGMSMETANQLLRDWRDINRARVNKAAAATQASRVPPPPAYSPPPDQTGGVTQEVERLRLTGAELPHPETPPQQRQHPQQPPFDRRQQQQPLPGAFPVVHPPGGMPPPIGARPAVAPAFPHEPIVPPGVRPPPSYDQPPPAATIADSTPPQGRLTPQPQQQPLPPSLPPKPYPPAPFGVVPPQHRGSYPPLQQQPSQQQTLTQQVQRSPPQQQQQQQQVVKKRKVGLDDFNFLAVLGKGNFGKVMLAEEKTTSNLYAIKVLKKEFIIDNDEVESTRSEKRVFLAAARERHPFLLGLHSCFQTETRVYFVMEYVSGGDLMLHIQRKQFSLRQAKFYASEVLLALEYFHANGIIYRDLKLDNILLTLDGHVKVADYGLCKEEMWHGSTTGTFCGTPEFMAPEILLEQRYGRAVDWWAFGVLTYEMLLGQSPFRGDDEDEIFDAILEDEPLYPITMPRDAVSILQKLLTRDPARRLGSGKSDAEEIKRHPFFKDVNFDDIFNKRVPPPYFPTINGSADTSNFDEEFTKEQPTLTPVHGQLTTRDQAEFNGFSWVASWAQDG
ncbi:hypothetical protein B0F90DRAFT_1249140 [Multifurca ochricompacta]|uniref:protein kinase C n=1 Tax=Multifurca ochricompacta TaxID=376703 RepID=A0AAD4M7B2_9AGAM|nr:hypothetical protein B0F90DRAFT_1249140 [Multifurca ochricompacta]